MEPDYAEAWNNRGVARAPLGDVAGAIADYNQAINLKPDLAEAWSNRGNARVRQADFIAAIADYDQAISLNPEKPAFHHNRALALGRQGAQESGEKLEKELTEKHQENLAELSEQIKKDSAVLYQEKLKEFTKLYQEKLAELSEQIKKDSAELRDQYAAHEKQARILYRCFYIGGSVLGVSLLVLWGYLYSSSDLFDIKTNPFRILPYIAVSALLSSPFLWLLRQINLRAKEKTILSQRSLHEAILRDHIYGSTVDAARRDNLINQYTQYLMQGSPADLLCNLYMKSTFPGKEAIQQIRKGFLSPRG